MPVDGQTIVLSLLRLVSQEALRTFFGTYSKQVPNCPNKAEQLELDCESKIGERLRSAKELFEISLAQCAESWLDKLPWVDWIWIIVIIALWSAILYRVGYHHGVHRARQAEVWGLRVGPPGQGPPPDMARMGHPDGRPAARGILRGDPRL